MIEWCEGRTAWALGQSKDANPYVGENYRYSEWLAGWLMAERVWGGRTHG